MLYGTYYMYVSSVHDTNLDKAAVFSAIEDMEWLSIEDRESKS